MTEPTKDTQNPPPTSLPPHQGGDLSPSQIDPESDPIDAASDDSFPASDPPSTTMATTPESESDQAQ
ncbi:MAG: hypothetical protein H0X24_09420 [Ktedonobacterales bacterium]|nr:hypothetical protein [Ktedonobacterales bacterium]